MGEAESVELSDLGEQIVSEAELLELLRDAERGAWFHFEYNGGGTWTVYTGLARGLQWPDPAA